MPVLTIFWTGVLKVAHLLLLFLVSVLGAPNAEIEKALASWRTAFRAGFQQTTDARLIVPRHFKFLNDRLLQVQRCVNEEVADREMTEGNGELLCGQWSMDPVI